MKWSPLLSWYRRHGRKLPWRNTRDPYRILVSEIMLQQTQVSRVLDFYARWLKQFPTWHALARASNTEVIHAWAGLGYNRRGLMLRDIARTITQNQIPKTEAGWLTLKGIGPYTAAALSAFSQGQKTVPIDTNIRRVLGRVLFGKPFANLQDDDRLKKKVGPQSPETWQAVFDLAVAICTKNPDCTNCPMRSQCPASKKFLSGKVVIPKRSLQKANENHHRNKPFPDRIYRGRILKEARNRNVDMRTIGAIIDPDFDKKKDAAWLLSMVRRLEKDGLIRVDKNSISV